MSAYLITPLTESTRLYQQLAINNPDEASLKLKEAIKKIRSFLEEFMKDGGLIGGYEMTIDMKDSATGISLRSFPKSCQASYIPTLKPLEIKDNVEKEDLELAQNIICKVNSLNKAISLNAFLIVTKTLELWNNSIEEKYMKKYPDSVVTGSITVYVFSKDGAPCNMVYRFN